MTARALLRGIIWLTIGAPKGTKFAFSMLEAPQLESVNSRTVVRVGRAGRLASLDGKRGKYAVAIEVPRALRF